MRQLQQIFLFIRWPITLGLIAALMLLAFFPDTLNLSLPKVRLVVLEQPEATSTGPYGVVSYAEAVAKASLSVVNIYTRKQINQRVHPFFDDPIFRLFFNSADIPRKQRMQSALGSGVIVTADGHILTNFHVIDGADEIVVALEDGRNARASVLGEHRERDLAVLVIDLPNLTPVNKSERPSLVGDVVLAIGNPFGVGQTVTQGIISATQERKRNLNISEFEDFIQTDAAIHPGSSGGALIDVYGNLLGINTANLAQSGGIGFAIPIDIAMQTLDDIIRYGRVVRGWLGVEARELSPRGSLDATLDNGQQIGGGMLVTGTTVGGPAAVAGLQRGDIIIGISGHRIKSPKDILQTIQESRPGETVSIEFIRGNHIESLDVILQEQPLAAT